MSKKSPLTRNAEASEELLKLRALVAEAKADPKTDAKAKPKQDVSLYTRRRPREDWM